MLRLNKNGVKCRAECDHDWKDATDTSANGTVSFSRKASDEAVLAVLADDEFVAELADEFGNKYVGFEAQTINGEEASESAAWSLARAIADHLEAHPGVRIFQLDGVIG